MAKCSVCRKTSNLVPLMFPMAKGVKYICRCGHFEGVVVDALTQLPVNMTGSWTGGLTWPRAFTFKERLFVREWAFLEAVRFGWRFDHAARLALMR